MIEPASGSGSGWRRLCPRVDSGPTLAFAGGLLWAALLLARSDGTPLQDEVGHILVARDAWRDPVLIFSEWGRVANTLLYMPSAPFGLGAARVFSLALSGLTVLLTIGVARRVGIRALWTVPLLAWFQPWFASLSFLAITEVPLSLLAVLGVWLTLQRRWVLGGFALGFLPLARHEAIVLLAVWVLIAIYRGQIWGALVSLVPELAYNVLAFLARSTWPAAIYFAAKPTELYGSGTWLHYLPGLMLGIGLPILLLTLLGLRRLVRRPTGLLVCVWYAIYLAVHVVVFRFGLFASAGYDFFLLPLVVPVALLAAFGVDAVQDWIVEVRARHAAPHARRWPKTLPGVVMMVAILSGGLVVQPYPADPEQIAMADAARWLRDEHVDPSQVLATHVWLYYYLPLQIPVGPDLWATEPPLDSVSIGTTIVWDSHYSERWGWPWTGLVGPGEAWHRLRSFGTPDDVVVIFRKV